MPNNFGWCENIALVSRNKEHLNSLFRLCSGVYTILAPNNAAFDGLAPGVLEAIQSDAALLKSVLLYHVIANRTMTSAMTNELKLTSMQGEAVRFNRYNHNNVSVKWFKSTKLNQKK